MMSSNQPSGAVAAEPDHPADVLITGATGYLGASLVRYLHGRGYKVRALVRQLPLTPLAGVADTLDWATAKQQPQTLEKLLSGVSSVIHFAASNSKDAVQQRDTHVQMPVELLKACAAFGVRRFIAASSVKAIAGERHSSPLLVSTVPAPTSDYGRYKLQAEEAIRSHPANAELASWILRLPMVYGGGERGNFGLLCKVARTGLPLPVAADNLRSVLYVGNLCACIERLLGEPVVAGSNTLHVADSAAVSTRELFKLIAAAQEASGRCITLSSQWAERLAAVPVLGALSTRLLGSLELDLESLQQLGGWRVPFSTSAAIAAEVGLQDPPCSAS